MDTGMTFVRSAPGRKKENRSRFVLQADAQLEIGTDVQAKRFRSEPLPKRDSSVERGVIEKSSKSSQACNG